MKEKRKNHRFQLTDVITQFFCHRTVETRWLEIIDISLGGISLRFPSQAALPKPQSLHSINLQLPGDLGGFSLSIKTHSIDWSKKRIARFQFVDVQPSTVAILVAYIDYQRNQQIIKVSRKILDGFYGPIQPPKGF